MFSFLELIFAILERLTDLKHLAVESGASAVRHPLDLEFPGAYWIGPEEEEAVMRVVRACSPFRFYGPHLQGEVDNFEQAARDYYGVKYALGVNSATGALMVSLVAMGIGPGDEVIVPGFMWISTVSAVVELGAVPVLCEIDENKCCGKIEFLSLNWGC